MQKKNTENVNSKVLENKMAFKTRLLKLQAIQDLMGIKED